MAQIAVTALSQMLPEDVTSDCNMIVFTSDGDTNQVAFEAAVAQANVNNGCECLHSASLAITSAQVLALNSTPLTIIAAQGVGTAIEIISASAKMVYNSAAYATNVDLILQNSGATRPISGVGSFLAETVNVMSPFRDQYGFSGVTDTQMIENVAVQVSVDSGNPTAGNSGITVYVLYRVITL